MVDRERLRLLTLTQLAEGAAIQTNLIAGSMPV
jgi:hypothetical protein